MQTACGRISWAWPMKMLKQILICALREQLDQQNTSCLTGVLGPDLVVRVILNPRQETADEPTHLLVVELVCDD